jgi:hypothetical protein
VLCASANSESMSKATYVLSGEKLVKIEQISAAGGERDRKGGVA